MNKVALKKFVKFIFYTSEEYPNVSVLNIQYTEVVCLFFLKSGICHRSIDLIYDCMQFLSVGSWIKKKKSWE